MTLQIGKDSDRKLDLVKINSAQKQVVAGLNYILVVETAAGGDKETYEAKVYGELIVRATHSELAESAKLRMNLCCEDAHS